MGYIFNSPLPRRYDSLNSRMISNMKDQFTRGYSYVRKNPSQKQITNPNSVDLPHFLFFILLGFFLVVFIPLIFADKNDF